MTGIVSSTAGPVANATVTIDGTPIPATTTDADGRYAFAAVPFGTYRMTVTGRRLLHLDDRRSDRRR